MTSWEVLGKKKGRESFLRVEMKSEGTSWWGDTESAHVCPQAQHRSRHSDGVRIR